MELYPKSMQKKKKGKKNTSKDKLQPGAKGKPIKPK
jgi:hypothetical protein